MAQTIDRSLSVPRPRGIFEHQIASPLPVRLSILSFSAFEDPFDCLYLSKCIYSLSQEHISSLISSFFILFSSIHNWKRSINHWERREAILEASFVIQFMKTANDGKINKNESKISQRGSATRVTHFGRPPSRTTFLFYPMRHVNNKIFYRHDFLLLLCLLLTQSLFNFATLRFIFSSSSSFLWLC